MPSRNTQRYFEELNEQRKGRAPGSPEFEALIRSKIGGQFQGLVNPKTMAKAELIGKPEDQIYGQYAGVNFGPRSTLKGIKEELLGRGGAWTSSLPNQVPNLPEGKTIFGMGRQANPNVWSHEFRHENVSDATYFDGEVANRLFDVLYGSTSLPAYKSNVEQAYRFILRKSDDYKKLPFEDREALNAVSLKDQEGFVLNRLKGLLSEQDLKRENVSTSSRMLNALKNTFSKDLFERTKELNQSVRRTEDLPKEAIELRSKFPFLNFVGKLEEYENPVKRAAGSPPRGEATSSKEELRKLMLAMNPDAEQIEEAAAAAPKVPAAAKALGKGFYEANIAPLLSPKETAMAIFGAGREFVKDPKAFGEAAAKSELERLKAAGEKPEAAAEYYGGLLSPFSMLRRMPNRSEIDAYHASPAKFKSTADNPLGEFDITKMGSGIGQQQRGPGTYIAEMKRAANRFRLAPGSGDLSKGFMYTVDLPDSMIEKMLDLDAPIMNQPKIRETLLKIADDNVLPPESADYLRYMLTSTDETLRKYPLTGQGLVAVPRELGGIFRDNVEANTILQRYGIPGSKWDAGLFKEDIAKGREKASRNFVVFPGEERKVRILEREGGGERVKSTPVKRAAGSPPKGETSASQEELRRLIRAMNPDSEQIEEAAAAAPRVPSVAKSLGKGFYEANVAPLLSPYDTAMAIFGAGKEFVSDPKEFSKSVARAEMERLRAAGDKPEAAAEYYGGFLSPFSMLRRVPPTSNVIKPKGGDFPKNLTPIESLNFKFPGDVVEQLPPVRRENLTKIMPAVNNWISTKLDRYIRTEMATPEDPIRKLAEQDILHVAPDTFGTFRQVIRYGRSGDERQLLGKSDTAKAWEDASDQALQTHRAQDIVSGAQGGTQRNQQNVDPYVARFLAGQVGQDQILAGNTPASLRQLDLKGGIYKDMLEEDPWIATVAQKDPNRPIYFPRKNLADDLGFRHLKDELFNSLRSDSDLPQQLRMTPEQLGRMSVPDAVRHVSKINRWREKQKAEANLALATNAATVPFKDYPNQKFGWFQLKANTPQGRRALEDALKYEGDMMGHCVGGYCEDVFSGRSEIYSLRNKKTGEPHVTIEVTQPIRPGDFYYQTADQGVPPSFISRLDEAEKSGKPFNWEQIVKESPEYQALPKTILQIKGKGDRKPNATYIPFVQDFVRSQNWRDIRELRNADLVDLNDTVSALAWANTKMATHVSPEALKSLQNEGVRFATIEELNARHSAMVKERVAARKAAESPEQKAARQQLRELRRAERRRERGE